MAEMAEDPATQTLQRLEPKGEHKWESMIVIESEKLKDRFYVKLLK